MNTVRGVGGTYSLVNSPSGETKLNLDHPQGQLSLFKRLGAGAWVYFNFHTQDWLEVSESEIIDELESVFGQLSKAERDERTAKAQAERSKPIDRDEIMRYVDRCTGSRLTRLVLSNEDSSKVFVIPPETFDPRRFAGLVVCGLVYLTHGFAFHHIVLPRTNEAIASKAIRMVEMRAAGTWSRTPQWRARQRLIEGGNLFD